MPQPTTARIEVFRPGTFVPMKGDAITYSAADLRAIADAYDPDTAPAPIVVGHPEADAPAFGWVRAFSYDADAERLFADVHEIEPQFADMVKAGRFKKVSMAFFAPTQAHNPVPGTWYPKHLGFLGAAAPAVSGLRNAAFAAEATVITAEFGERGFEETASILRGLRDFFIEKFGLESADQALPSYRIEWLAEAEVAGPHHPAFSSLPANPDKQEKEPAVKTTDPAFAAREAELNARAAALADREAKLRHDEHVSFAETLIAGGKLIPASRDTVVALLDAMPDDQTVAFSEGEAKSLSLALRDVLEAQPVAVAFGEADMSDAKDGAARPAAFASADGAPVDTAGLTVHSKALDFQRANPGTAYLDAVRAVS